LVRPVRRWGQNWLASERLADDLAAAIAPRTGDLFLEIGPGLGRLTRALLRHHVRVLAVEVDPRCCAELERLGDDRLELVQADILDADAMIPWDRGLLRVVGNLPYNVSSPILRWTADHSDGIVDAHYMLQEEVAERAAAHAGDSQYGWISVVLAWVFEVTIVKRLSPGAFRPPPKVRSAFVRLVPRAAPAAPEVRERAATIASAAFTHRRKKWPRSLALSGWDRDVVAAAAAVAGISEDLRAEAISPDGYLALARALPIREEEE
jgi:16S rRNA (adenine1518-N6/adenine1519-N6)-dimethyltransferase